MHRRSHPQADEDGWLRTTSVEETRAVCTSLFGATRIEPLDHEPFGWEHLHARMGSAGIAFGRHNSRVEISAPGGDLFTLLVARDGHGESSFASEGVPLRAGAFAVMVSPDTETASRVSAGYRGGVVSLPRLMIEREVGALLDGEASRPVRFDPRVDLAVGGGAEVARMVAYLVGEAERPRGVVGLPSVAEGLSQALVQVLLDRLRHSHSEALYAMSRPAPPAYLRRAEEFLAANLDRAVSGAELAAAVGVSVRAVQLAFRRHRGCSPFEFVRERRLDAARRRLLALRGTTVTDVALACGFANLGRFSAAYHARFGEPPSKTLRRVEN